jgi:hypothetical protein
MQVARRLQYGCTWINTHFMLVNEMPHGGLKQSGYGKDLSMYALEDYTVRRAPRHVHGQAEQAVEFVERAETDRDLALFAATRCRGCGSRPAAVSRSASCSSSRAMSRGFPA